MIIFTDLILKNPNQIKLKDETGVIHNFEIIEPSGDEIEQESTTPISSDNLMKMQTILRIVTTIQSTITANTDYTLPISFRVGDNSLEVYYCGTKLAKGIDYNEIGENGSVSTTIQFLDDLGDLDMSSVEGFEDFEETLEFIVRGEYNAS